MDVVHSGMHETPQGVQHHMAIGQRYRHLHIFKVLSCVSHFTLSLLQYEDVQGYVGHSFWGIL